MEYAVEFQNLCKVYGPEGGDEKIALKDICLKIPRGSFFGILGRNGAGKSTMINIMAGLARPTSGVIRICGYDHIQDMREARMNIGIVPQELLFDPFFTPYEVLEMNAGYYGIAKKHRRTEEILNLLGLADKAHSSSRSLSGGMRRRLLIGKAMVHNPPVLVLDEPTAGVDVELRHHLWESLRALNDQGVTIVLITHYLQEAQELCDSLAVISEGQIIQSDTKENLLGSLGCNKIVFTFDRVLDIQKDSFQELMDYQPIVKGCHLTLNVRLGKGFAGDSPRVYDQFFKIVSKKGYSIVDVRSKDTDLEDIYLSLLEGREERQGIGKL